MKKLIFIFFTSMFFLSPLYAQDNPLGFFLTSVGVGNGADLGGLAGADAHCEMLADKVGAGQPGMARISQHSGS